MRRTKRVGDLRRRPVTDPHQDAPDGTLLHLPEWGGVFQRCGDYWEAIEHADRLTPGSGMNVGGGVLYVDVERCESRFRDGQGRIRYRCGKAAGHSHLVMHGDGSGGHRWR